MVLDKAVTTIGAGISATHSDLAVNAPAPENTRDVAFAFSGGTVQTRLVFVSGSLIAINVFVPAGGSKERGLSMLSEVARTLAFN
jgi:hypothetical protein